MATGNQFPYCVLCFCDDRPYVSALTKPFVAQSKAVVGTCCCCADAGAAGLKEADISLLMTSCNWVIMLAFELATQALDTLHLIWACPAEWATALLLRVAWTLHVLAAIRG